MNKKELGTVTFDFAKEKLIVKGDILDKALVRDMVTKKEGGYSRESEVTDEDSYSPRKRLAEEGAA